MAGRRIIYLASLLGCLVFYYFYREWLSWLFLMTVGALPWFSLLVSLPAIFTARGHLDLPGDLQIGEDCQVTARLTASSPILQQAPGHPRHYRRHRQPEIRQKPAHSGLRTAAGPGTPPVCLRLSGTVPFSHPAKRPGRHLCPSCSRSPGRHPGLRCKTAPALETQARRRFRGKSRAAALPSRR